MPVAITVFPHEIYRAPESWSRQAYPALYYFHEVPKEGHFVAWEQPELFSIGRHGEYRYTKQKKERPHGRNGLEFLFRPEF